MVWDLLRLRHVRTLPELARPVTALKIQPLTVHARTHAHDTHTHAQAIFGYSQKQTRTRRAGQYCGLYRQRDHSVERQRRSVGLQRVAPPDGAHHGGGVRPRPGVGAPQHCLRHRPRRRLHRGLACSLLRCLCAASGETHFSFLFFFSFSFWSLSSSGAWWRTSCADCSASARPPRNPRSLLSTCDRTPFYPPNPRHDQRSAISLSYCCARRDDKALYSGNATGQVILWSSQEELEAERAQRNKEISTSLSRY